MTRQEPKKGVISKIKIKEMLFMKIAVTSKGTDLDSEVDSMYGNTPYTLIVDTFSLGIDVIEHSMKEKAKL